MTSFKAVCSISLKSAKNNELRRDKDGTPQVRLNVINGIAPNRLTISGRVSQSLGLISINGADSSLLIRKALVVFSSTNKTFEDEDGNALVSYDHTIDMALEQVGEMPKFDIALMNYQDSLGSAKIINVDEDVPETPEPTPEPPKKN